MPEGAELDLAEDVVVPNVVGLLVVLVLSSEEESEEVGVGLGVGDGFVEEGAAEVWPGITAGIDVEDGGGDVADGLGDGEGDGEGEGEGDGDWLGDGLGLGLINVRGASVLRGPFVYATRTENCGLIPVQDVTTFSPTEVLPHPY